MSLTETVAELTKLSSERMRQALTPVEKIDAVLIAPGQKICHPVDRDILSCRIEFGFDSDADIDRLTDTALEVNQILLARVSNWRIKSLLGGKITQQKIWVPFNDLFPTPPAVRLYNTPEFTMRNVSDSELKIYIRTERIAAQRNLEMVPLFLERQIEVEPNVPTLVNGGVAFSMLYVYTADYAPIASIELTLGDKSFDIGGEMKIDGRTFYVIPLSDDWVWGRFASTWVSQAAKCAIKCSAGCTVGTYSNNLLYACEGMAINRYVC